jgi:hypothetical protein
MKVHPDITTDRVIDAVQNDDLTGFCLACGEDAYNVEPDARQYPCEACDENAVYGAQEVLFMTVA